MAEKKGLGLGLALIGGALLLSQLPRLQILGTQDALTKQSEDLQNYEQDRITDAARIEAERAQEGLAEGSYGTVGGSIGAWTGTWTGIEGDRCSVMYATPQSSTATRFFEGGYCRSAREMGLIE